MRTKTSFAQRLLRLSSLFFLVSKVKPFVFNGGMDIMDANRRKISRLYLRGVHSFRQVFISAAAIIVAAIFFIASFVVLHVVIFAYTPWATETKVVLGLALALLYFLVAAGIVYTVVENGRWLKMFHAHGLACKEESSTA